MDKELLRVVIIASGLIIIVGMLAWHFFKNKKSFQGTMFFGNLDIKGKINDALVVHTDNDDFDIVPKDRKKLIDTDELLEKIKLKTKPKPKSKRLQPEQEQVSDPAPGQEPEPDQTGQMFDDFDDEFDFADSEYFVPGKELEEEALEQRFIAPEIIQFSVLAKSAEGFNGLDLLKAFRIAQMEYGSLRIFERLDANRLVDFGVACLVASGTFPDHDLDEFYCPGLVFFMQPAVLDDPVKVFDDFLEAINIVAVELDGNLLDHERKPLTNSTIQLIRQSL
ncbi:MAG: cell division protein ZipA C-terminal FtsZ-binding domain-containing protein [Methylovulum sp.]|uniref:cell division protein ZipA C-terminal FtsZ-binding domain-containing protein n=1 Tax=Methylovulum sp. TaxID=1916980 RepID=UPI0026237137|nr:cell division protein ZipA C-terminal FtsZ-binding domain-containing protein [Methylovulum sp.]MDD2723518.1 cell division protein ZipA C-terminal FtsZ-binding domain-containing protein [Methylovulum sp.]MDD5124524.1 cell division protein ZipA C-terminal FtsZ-binding domain-containing protein [Methylovulum sp.]